MKRYIELLVLLSCALIDRYTKWWAIDACRNEMVVTPWLSCETAYNRGVAFSLGNSGHPLATSVISALGLLLIIFCAYQFFRVRAGRSLLPWGLILVGAVSNFIDRFFYPGVIDFIVMHHAGWCWPTYNIADALICCGVILVLLTEER